MRRVREVFERNGRRVVDFVYFDPDRSESNQAEPCLAGELQHCLALRIFSRLLTEGSCQTGVIIMPRFILSWYRVLRARYQFPVFEAIRCALWLYR